MASKSFSIHDISLNDLFKFNQLKKFISGISCSPFSLHTHFTHDGNKYKNILPGGKKWLVRKVI